MMIFAKMLGEAGIYPLICPESELLDYGFIKCYGNSDYYVKFKIMNNSIEGEIYKRLKDNLFGRWRYIL